MNSRKEIHKRVAQIRKEEAKAASKIFQSLFSLVLLLMCCTAVVLCDKIYQAHGFDSLIESAEIWGKNLNLTQLKQWLFLEKWLDDQTVSVISDHYVNVKDQMFETSNHEVYSIEDGIVIYVGEQNDGIMVMIRQDNGIIAGYGGLNEVFCEVDDRLTEGAVFAKTEEYVLLDFSYEGKSMSYEQAVSFSN